MTTKHDPRVSDRYIRRHPHLMTFAELRAANVARLPHFKNARGEPAHIRPDGGDWSLGEWMCAVAGELGEAANLIKKIKRGDLSLDDPATHKALADEFADVLIYLDILAFRAGVDLSHAVIEKWNETSERIGYAERL